MTSPLGQRPRKAGAGPQQQYPSLQAEALGLSIHPVNSQDSSPPLASMQPANKQQQQRGSQIRDPSMTNNAPPGSSGLSREAQPSSYGPQPYSSSDPPSPSHTASPPSTLAGFPQQQSPPLPKPPQQQSPPQMPLLQQTASHMSGFNRAQNRVPPPNFDPTASNSTSGNVAAGGRNDSSSGPPWISPPHVDDNLPRRKTSDERDEQQPLQMRDWDRERIRVQNGSIGDAMALRSSPTSQLNQQQQQNPNTRTTRPKGPVATSSSPVSSMTNAQRQQNQQQQSASPPTAASASQTRKEAPLLQGLIAPHVSPTIPLLSRSNTENASMAAVAAGVRPVLTPPTSYNSNNTNAASPPQRRGDPSGPYQSPSDSPQNLNSAHYLSSTSYSSSAPFEFDHDDDRDPRAARRSELEEWKRKDPYGREQSPSPLNLKPGQQQQPPQQPPQPQPQQSQQQQQQQAARDREKDRQPQRHLGGDYGNAVVNLNPNPVAGAGGAGAAGPAPGPRMQVMRFPVHEEFDDDGDGDVQPVQEAHPPVRWMTGHQQQNHVQDHRRRDSRDKMPTPPPAEPVPHPPIPLFSPQANQAAQPPLLSQPPRDSTPSPPAAPVPLRINQSQPPEDDEPAVESSDHYTPKSPNAPLPADHGYSYSNTNSGRYSYNPGQYGYQNNGASQYGGLQHALFAMQMSGMPMPRGPMPNYAARESFVSLSGAAAALTHAKPESPYQPPLPPPSINTSNLNGSSGGAQSGYGGSAERSSTFGDMNSAGGGNTGPGDPWDSIEQSYAEFMEYQRRFGNQRPDAPIPPTPHSYTAPQNPQGRPQQGYGGGGGGNQGNNNGNNNNTNNTNTNNNNGYGMGGVWDPSMIPDRYIPSALSSYLSSPMMHNPFLPRFPAPPSLVSSPSHIPLDLPGPPFPGRRVAKKKSKRQLRGQYGSGSGGHGSSKTGSSASNGSHARSKLSQPPHMPEQPLPPRIGAESTIPGDSTSEDETDTDDTKKGSVKQVVQQKASGPSGSDTKYEETSADEDEDDDVWLDESSEDELDAEFHSRYIQNPSKRKRKWEQKWENMVRLVSSHTQDDPNSVNYFLVRSSRRSIVQRTRPCSSSRLPQRHLHQRVIFSSLVRFSGPLASTCHTFKSRGHPSLKYRNFVRKRGLNRPRLSALVAHLRRNWQVLRSWVPDSIIQGLEGVGALDLRAPALLALALPR
ncbi:hypothetical protein FRB95_003914 [Tulasnella sp. JGI-2019a]|nr:hypothetical protein FRB95_003914 [Tulasnella sp. JGI-2019a]